LDGRTLNAAVALAGVAAIAIGGVILYGGGPPPAPRRPKPPPADQATSEMKYSATLYRAMLEQDARTFGVPAARPEDLAKPFAYFSESSGPRRIKVGSSIQTPHLRLSLLVRKEGGSMEGQSYRADHLVLRIDNLTPKTLAYRVQTTVSDDARCTAKGDLPHNAIVIEPNKSVLRTECLYQSDGHVTITGVEVIEIPRISAFYLSRLPPGLVLYSTRTSAGHVPPKGTLCPQIFSWRDIRDGADRGEFGWKDVIDFYARHSCEEYAFFPTYRYRSDAKAPLPAKPLARAP
jgi:hypothetical protein